MGKRIALLLGASKYKNENDLPPCEQDLKLVHSIISGSEKYDDFLLLDESPRSVEAKYKISGFIRKNQGQDIDEVFVYYTGHGARHGDDFIYLFSDFDDAKIEQTSLRNSEFDSMLKSLGPALTVKVVDACQAGTEYIKSRNDLEIIFKKSSEESFNKTYFLFSSSNSESSIALGDYSVFTKSFAQSLLDFEGGEIRYRDVMAYISDDPNVKKHQTPLFIQQADNTEIFCSVSSDLAEALRSKLVISGRKSGTEVEIENGVHQGDDESEEDRLISAIRKTSEKYCSEDEAQASINILIQNILGHSWSRPIPELYTIESTSNEYVVRLGSIKSIAKWISESDEPYFARMTYEDEEYETKEKIEIEEHQPFGLGTIYGKKKLIEYKPITKYRQVLCGYEITAPTPAQSITVTFEPKEQILPWVKVFFTFVFSKSKLTLFFKHEIEKETSWKNRVLQDKNQWKTQHCELKNKSSIDTAVNDTFASVEKSIVEIISSSVDLE